MATTFQNSILNGGAPEFVPGQRIHSEIQPSTCVFDVDDCYGQHQHQYHSALGYPDADYPEQDYPFLEHPVDEFYGHHQDHYYFPPTGPWLNPANNHVQPMNNFSGQHQHSDHARMAGYTTQNYSYDEDLVQFGQRANDFSSKRKNRNKKKDRKGKRQRQKNEEEAEVKEVEKKEEKGGKNNGWNGDAEVSDLNTW